MAYSLTITSDTGCISYDMWVCTTTLLALSSAKVTLIFVICLFLSGALYLLVIYISFVILSNFFVLVINSRIVALMLIFVNLHRVHSTPKRNKKALPMESFLVARLSVSRVLFWMRLHAVRCWPSI